MPKKADPSLKTESGIYHSQIRQSEIYEKKVERLVVRVPKGSGAAIAKYVEEKAEAEPENLKYSSYNGKAYRPSVNALIRSLIEDEMGVNLDELKVSD